MRPLRLGYRVLLKQAVPGQPYSKKVLIIVATLCLLGQRDPQRLPFVTLGRDRESGGIDTDCPILLRARVTPHINCVELGRNPGPRDPSVS